MAQTDYAAKAATARRLIQKFGTTLQVKRTTTTGGSPSTGGGSTTTNSHPFAGVVLPVDLQKAHADAPGSLVKAGDFTAYLEAGPIAPTTTDRLICPQGDLAIIEAVALAPAGVTVMWTITARKG